jgi:hypothetical protein
VRRPPRVGPQTHLVIRGRSLLAMRFAARGCSRRRIPPRGRSMTYALATGM